MGRDWNHLPAELKIQILKDLVADDLSKDGLAAGKEVMRNALIARRVCKTWEHIMNRLFIDYIDHSHVMTWGPESLCRQIVEADLKALNKHIEAEDLEDEYLDDLSLGLRSFLWEAIDRGFLSCVSLIMDNDPLMDLIETFDPGNSLVFYPDLLHAAIAADKPKVLSLLLEYDWMEDSIDDLGSELNTPLGEAILSKCDIMVDILLDYGASPDVTATWGQPTPDGNWTQSTTRLISLAVERNDTWLVRRLVESGLDIHGSGECHSILVDALLNRNIEIAKLLIECGAEVTQFACPHSDLPLHTAIRHCSLDAVKMLLDAGADIAAIDYGGKDALSAALMSSKPEIVSFLLDRGAAVKLVHKDLLVSLALSPKPFGIIDDSGHYCSLSCMLGLTYATHLALKRGVNPNFKDPDGPFNSLLDAAVHHKRTAVVKLLLKAGADASNIDSAKLNAAFKNGS